MAGPIVASAWWTPSRRAVIPAATRECSSGYLSCCDLLGIHAPELSADGRLPSYQSQQRSPERPAQPESVQHSHARQCCCCLRGILLSFGRKERGVQGFSLSDAVIFLSVASRVLNTFIKSFGSQGISSRCRGTGRCHGFHLSEAVSAFASALTRDSSSASASRSSIGWYQSGNEGGGSPSQRRTCWGQWVTGIASSQWGQGRRSTPSCVAAQIRQRRSACSRASASETRWYVPALPHSGSGSSVSSAGSIAW